MEVDNRNGPMKVKWNWTGILFLAFFGLSCERIGNIEKKIHSDAKYENAALSLARANRELDLEISRLKFEINSLKTKNEYLSSQLKDQAPYAERVIASIAPLDPLKKAPSLLGSYKWTPEKMLAVAEEEFNNKNYDKAAQFFYRFSELFPSDERINDLFFFQAGIASSESKHHRDRALDFLRNIIENYPKSEFYRGAKLWTALIRLENGDQQHFAKTLEEFRKKYRNTPEWKILSQHYEKYVL